MVVDGLDCARAVIDTADPILKKRICVKAAALARGALLDQGAKLSPNFFQSIGFLNKVALAERLKRLARVGGNMAADE